LINCLKLDYSHSYILEGFRKNEAFINRHKGTLNMLSDKQWRENAFMNTEKNISSPTRSILGRYICNVLAALFVDISENKIDKLVVTCESLDSLDSYSRYVFHVIEEITDIPIEFQSCKKLIEKIEMTPERMRTQIKRGFYDRILCSNRELFWIYEYFESIFKGKSYKLDQLIKQYIETKGEYEKWILIKSIINQGIRQDEKEIVENFLERLKENNQGRYDYINSFSFYLLKFKSKDEARKFLETHLDVSDFLKSDTENYAQSLVFKNYASLLPMNSSLKKEIMEKCLSQTPQDTDLWKEWFDSFASREEIRQKATEIFKSGYSDPALLQLVLIEPSDVESLVRMIILSSTKENIDVAIYLISFLNKEKLINYLENYISTFDFSDPMRGEVNDNCF